MFIKGLKTEGCSLTDSVPGRKIIRKYDRKNPDLTSFLSFVTHVECVLFDSVIYLHKKHIKYVVILNHVTYTTQTVNNG